VKDRPNIYSSVWSSQQDNRMREYFSERERERENI